MTEPSGSSVLLANWPAPPSIRAFTTLRTGPGLSQPPFDRFNLGLRCGDDPLHAQENRRILIREYGLPADPVWLNQVHGTTVAVLRPPDITVQAACIEATGADASTTSAVGLPLAILTADCLPVTFCNRAGTEIANAHAGWRGLVSGVLEATIDAMQSAPDDLIAWLGPAAGPDAYEVGAEVRDAFIKSAGEAEAAFTATRPGHWRVDLYRLARQRLTASGVTKVFGGGLCTITDSQCFYSHRREQRTGRMATVIYIS